MKKTRSEKSRDTVPLRSPGVDSQPGGIDSLGSIPGLLKRLQIGAPYCRTVPGAAGGGS
jgi:hypothetical protein